MAEGESRDDSLSTASDAQAFFRDIVGDVVSDRGFDTTAASEMYLVGLLTDAAQSPAAIAKAEQPFAVRLAKAMSASGGERFERLRQLGDDVLFVSGFFSEHLKTRGLAPDYVTSLGQCAYGGAASMLRRHTPEPQVFDELASNFAMFVALLQHVSDSLFATSLRDGQGVLELYERWQRSRSPVLADALLEFGLLPTDGSSESN